MIAKICWMKGEFEDSMILKGTIEEIQRQAMIEMDRRKPDHWWSVILEE